MHVRSSIVSLCYYLFTGVSLAAGFGDGCATRPSRARGGCLGAADGVEVAPCLALTEIPSVMQSEAAAIAIRPVVHESMSPSVHQSGFSRYGAQCVAYV